MRLAPLIASFWLGLPTAFALPALIPDQSELWSHTPIVPLSKRGLANNVQLRIMPLGASIVNGYYATDRNGFRYALRNKLVWDGNPVNMIGSQQMGTMLDNDVEGHPGFVIDQIREKAALNFYARPNIVLLHVGTNDMNQNPVDAYARLRSLIQLLFDNLPGVTIIASTLLPNADPVAQSRLIGYNNDIRNGIADFQRAGRKITYVDFSSSWFSLADLGDGTHPNDAGYLKMAAVWYQGIEVAAKAGWIVAPAVVNGVSDITIGGNKCWKIPGQATGPFITQRGSGRDDGPYIHTATLMPSFDGYNNPSPVLFNNPKPEGVYWADINGDGIDDYVYVAADSVLGFGVSLSSATGDRGPYLWWPFGISCERAGVRWADMTGDGRDDFCCLVPNGDLYCWQNNPGADERVPFFTSMGLLIGGKGYDRAHVRLADIDGDGRVDYIGIDPTMTKMYGWRNGANANLPPAYWNGMNGVIEGLPVKPTLSGWRFTDLNGDHKDDLIYVDGNGQITTWINKRGFTLGYTPLWTSMGVTHGGGTSPRTVAMGKFMGSGRADYADITIAPSGNVRIAPYRNGDSGGTLSKADGSRYCDMTGNGSDDYIWISAMGEMTLFVNIHSWGAGGAWKQPGVIYNANRARKEIHLADWNGDGKCDILLVDKATGATTVLRNDYNAGTDKYAFTNLGVQSGAAYCNEGYGYHKHDLGVRWHDLDGDGRADFLCITMDGFVSGWLNRGPGNMQDYGQIKRPEGKERRNIRFADIDGDGRDDLVYVQPMTGETVAWRNLAPVSPRASGSSFLWAGGVTIASGGSARGACIEFGNLNGQGRADYIIVEPSENTATAYFNVCPDGGIPPVPPSLPAGAPSPPGSTPTTPSTPTALPNTEPDPNQICKNLQFACLFCNATGVSVTEWPADRWRAAQGDAAIAEHNRWWRDPNSRPEREALKTQNTYVRSLPARVSKKDNVADWVCNLIGSTTCSSEVKCEDTGYPAASMIMTQWANLKTFYRNQQDAILVAGVYLSGDSGTFTETFIGEAADPNKAFKMFLTVVTSGFSMLQSGSWMERISENTKLNPDMVGSVIEQGVDMAKEKLEEPTTPLELQNGVNSAIVAIIAKLREANAVLISNLFNGSDSSMAAMATTLGEGVWLDPEIRNVDHVGLEKVAKRTITGMLLTQAWSIQDDHHPYIMHVNKKDYGGNPTAGNNFNYISNKDLKEAKVAIGDDTFYLLNFNDCTVSIPDQDGFPQCFQGGLQPIKGIGELQEADEKWSYIAKADIVTSAVAGWLLNDRKPGYEMPEASTVVNGEGKTSDVMFSNGILTPGFFNIPICDFGTAYSSWGEDQCDTYPCC